MNRLFIAAFALFLLCSTAVTAQQLPIFTQYREHSGFINPASINSDYFLSRGAYNVSLGTSYRRHWVRREQAPQTILVRGEHLMVPKYGGVGLLYGGNVVHDQTGPISFSGIYGRLGGMLRTGGYYSNDGFNLALSFGVVQYRMKATEVKLIDPNDPLGMQDQVRVIPDVGAGIFYHKELGNEDIIYGGISVPQLFALDLTSRNADDEFSVTRVRHYYAVR